MICLFGIFTPHAAQATLDDDVLVVPPGGLQTGTLLQTNLNDSDPVIRSRSRRLVDDVVGITDLRDFKITGTSSLLADNGTVGAAVVGTDFALQYAYRSSGLGHTTASVAGYGDAGRVQRILTASSAAGRASIVDRSLDQTLWNYSVTEPTSRMDYQKAIALPGQRVAFALDWPESADPISFIDIVSLQSDGETTRIASRSHAGAPANLVVEPAIEGIRDLFALNDRWFLFATPTRIGRISTDGNVIWELGIDDREAFGGRFSAVLGLPTGDFVVATRTPGRWIEPGAEHRVHWLGAESRTVLASSGALSFAPATLELAGGHGGSGTLGFQPDNSFVPVTDIGAGTLSTSLQIDPSPLIQGTSGALTVNLVNPSNAAVVLRSLKVIATRGSCEEVNEPETADPWVLLPPREVTLEQGSSQQVFGNFETTRQPEDSTWCARISITSEDDRQTLLSATSFRLVSSNSDAGPVGQDLGFYNPSQPGGRPDDPPRGCGCRQADVAGGLPTAPLLALVGVGLLVARRG